MLHDPAFQTTASVDKRGRGRAKDKQPTAKEESDDDDDSDSAAKRWARARGLAGPDTSESESDTLSSDDDSHSDASASPSLDNDAAAAAAAPTTETIPPAPTTTRRLAVIDLDWDRTRAVDVLAALRSFAPAAGRIDRVTVYPSDYGLARLADEDRRGPAPLRGGGDSGSDSDNDNDDPEKAAERLRAYEQSRLRYFYAIADCDAPRTAARIVDECDGIEFGRTGAVFDLRYVPDDTDFSARTPRDVATTVPSDYTPPDEVALATSHTRPDTGWDADDGGRRRALAAAARGGSAVKTGRANAEALRDDDFRAYLASDASSDDSDGGRDDAAAAAKYRALLAGGGDGTAAGVRATPRAGGKAWAAAGDGDDENATATATRTQGDLQVTFAGGLDALSTRLAERADASRSGGRASKTVWEEYLAKRAAKWAARKAGGRGSRAGDSSDSGSGGGGGGGDDAPPPPRKAGADPFDDPFFADDGGVDAGAAAAAGIDSEAEEAEGGGKKKKTEKKKTTNPDAPADADAAKRAAQLELVALDDAALRAGVVPRDAGIRDAADGGTGRKKLTRKERARERAVARAAGRAADDSDDDGGGADLADPRFNRLLSDPAFALDPTDPAFKRAGGAELAGRVRSAKATRKGGLDAPATAATVPAPNDDVLGSMVASLKRKAALAAGGRKDKAVREQ